VFAEYWSAEQQINEHKGKGKAIPVTGREGS
jgi:hypothetical protein